MNSRPSHIPRRTCSAEQLSPVSMRTVSSQPQQQMQIQQSAVASGYHQPPGNIAWQPASNLVVQPSSMFNRESMGRQSSIGRASSVSGRASIMKPGASGTGSNDIFKGMNPINMAQDISFTLQQFNLEYSTKMLMTPSTQTFFSAFEYLMQPLGFETVWNLEYLKASQQGGANQGGPNQPMKTTVASSSQGGNQQGAAQPMQSKQRIELVIFFLNFLEYPIIPKLSVFQTMTTPKNWSAMLQILYFLANNVRFLTLMNTSKILYAEEKNREFINSFLTKMFARTSTVPDFVNSEEFKKEKEEALQCFREHLEKSLNREQVLAEYETLKKEYIELKSNENEQEDLLNEEEKLKRLIETEESKIKKNEERLKEKINKLNAIRKELIVLNEKALKCEQEKAEREKEYEKQASNPSFKENLPQLQRQLLSELENLENACYDLEYKQTEWQEKIIAITELLKDKFAHANEISTRIRTESAIELKDFIQLDILDFNNKKTMVIKDYKDLILKVRKDYNAKVCLLPQKASQIHEEKNAVANRVSALRAKSANLDAELKKLDNLMRDLKVKSENALADAKLRVSQTKNELTTLERQMNAKEEELAAEQQRLRCEREEQEKLLRDINYQIEEVAAVFGQEYYDLLVYREHKEREFEEFKTAEMARVQEHIKQIAERNEEKRKQLEKITGIKINKMEKK